MSVKSPEEIQSALERNMASLLDIPIERKSNTQVQEVKDPVHEKEPEREQIDDDFDKSRENLKDLLETGQDALLYALSVAKQSDDPKAYNVVSNLIANLAAINEQMLKLHLHHQRHKVIAKEPVAVNPQLPAPNGSTTNNTVFIGTGADLAKLINGMNTNTIDITDVKEIEDDSTS